MFEFTIYAPVVERRGDEWAGLDMHRCGVVQLPARPSTRKTLTALRRAGFVPAALSGKLTSYCEADAILIADRWNGRPFYYLESTQLEILQ